MGNLLIKREPHLVWLVTKTEFFERVQVRWAGVILVQVGKSDRRCSSMLMIL